MDIQLSHDGFIDLSIGRSRKETSWKNKEWSWSQLLTKVSKTHRTPETLLDYTTAPKPRQDEIKDIGGFVGGVITGGRRKKGSVLNRQLITLDMDAGTMDVWRDLIAFNDFACCMYTTHKHQPDKPRLRILIPLDRPVDPTEYQAIARAIAGEIDIEAFDTTTFEPERLMYWPSTSVDAEFLFEYQDGPWLSADKILSQYHNWKDSSQWPISVRVDKNLHREMKKAGDPTEKAGLIGAWCRRYSITEVIENFLGDTYEPALGTAGDTENGNGRYTYLHGSTAAGLVIYDDKWAYSHHGTDPAGGKLCNAFDLVRLHYFGLKDDDEGIALRDRAKVTSLPSYVAMTEFASQDEGVKVQMGMETLAKAQEAFGGIPETDNSMYVEGAIDLPDNGTEFGSAPAFIVGSDGKVTDHANPAPDMTTEALNADWLKRMDVDKKGKYYSTIDNIMLILEHDPKLKARLAFNDFEKRECCLADLPWRQCTGKRDYLTDDDDAGLRHYLEKVYGITGQQKIMDGFRLVLRRNAFHPVRRYLDGLVWDGRPRLDRLLVDYFGAEDNEYVRAVTRKAFTAAVARIYRPGCKFDSVLTLLGGQGIGKSTLIKKMGGDWSSDSFNGIGTNQAYEQIQGVWLVEIAELAALKKAEIDMIKHFISKTEDRFRVAYGRKPETFVRQCVFLATSNDLSGFLKDQTGNRRWWAVVCGPTGSNRKSIFTDLTESEILQLWAEARHYYQHGEKLYLTGKVEKMAQQVQLEHTEVDERFGLVQQYLDMPLPEDWESRELWDRQAYVKGYQRGEIVPAAEHAMRDRVCVAEIWCEAMGGSPRDMTTHNTKHLHGFMGSMPGWGRSAGTLRFGLYGAQRGYLRDGETVKRGRPGKT